MTEMTARKRANSHDVLQTEQVVSLILGETTFNQDIRKLILGVNVSYLNLGIKIDSIEEQIKSNPLSSWHISHEGTSSFHYRLDNIFVIFKDV